MKILMVNKFHYVVGGSETYFFALKSLLQEQGHEVIEFSMKDERNLPSPYEKYFVDNVSYQSGGVRSKIRAGINIIYSKEARDKFEALIRATKPDLVHLHLFQHQISPSILDVIKKYHIPTVYTAHELKMICPNYRMLTHGEICERCKGKKYIQCALHKCVKDSFSKSLICTVESYLHAFKKSYDCIDKIITPSAFYRDKFIEFGVDADRVVHIPNFLDRDTPVVNTSDDRNAYFLYFGRLSHEKGIHTLVSAMKGIHTPLYIVGSGDERQKIEDRIARTGMNHVQLLGFKSGQELIDVVGNAKAVILPSEWYENGPYSAIEALQLGRPLIAANIGGIPELVKGNGILFEPKDVRGLHGALRAMERADEETCRTYETKSQDLFEKEYTPKIHYQRLMKVYEEAMKRP